MTKPRILIIENEILIARELEARLKGLDYAVVGIVLSGREAIQAASELRPDIVLMDIVLKGALDGISAADEIRTRFDIPVVYVTAYADESTLKRAKVTEPYGYIVKPFSESEVHAAIEMALYKHQKERNLREAKEAGLLSGCHCGVCLEVWVCLRRCSFVTLSRYIFLWLFGLLHAKYQRLQNLWLCGESTVWKRDSFVVNYQSPRAPVLD